MNMAKQFTIVLSGFSFQELRDGVACIKEVLTDIRADRDYDKARLYIDNIEDILFGSR